MQWLEAHAHCKGFKGDLVSFANKEEQDAVIAEALKGDDGPHWIGLYDMDIEGSWLWSDGTSFTWNNWVGREPDGGDKENCAILVHIKEWGWYDGPCSNKLSFVCKIPGKDTHTDFIRPI